jgi:acyl-coenzyme A synthetase/AMP-(fatty) acid ligase
VRASSENLGRADDVIKSSGQLIGPFEVENVLTEHPVAAEAGVIGKPDRPIPPTPSPPRRCAPRSR